MRFPGKDRRAHLLPVANGRPDPSEKAVAGLIGYPTARLVQPEANNHHIPVANHEHVVIVVSAGGESRSRRIRPFAASVGLDPVDPEIKSVSTSSVGAAVRVKANLGRNVISRSQLDSVGADKMTLFPYRRSASGRWRTDSSPSPSRHTFRPARKAAPATAETA